MKQYTYLHTPLAVIAVLGFLAYLLACRPSWSPDGTKVLLPYASEEKGQAGVVLYDRNLNKAKRVFSSPYDEGPAIQTQWDKRGDTAIVITFASLEPDEQSLQVHVLPLQAEAPKRLHRVKTKAFFFGAPFPQVGSSLFLGGYELIRLNLDDGTVKRVSLGEDRHIVMVQHDQGIFYLRQEIPSENTEADDISGESDRGDGDGENASGVTEDGNAQQVPEEEQPKTDDGVAQPEIGILDPESLRLDAFATLQLLEGEEVSPHFAVSPDGSSLAFMCRKDRKYRLLLVRDKKTQESLPVKLSTEPHAFGDLQWSLDGKIIYAAAGETVRRQGGTNIGVAEIDPTKGTTRVIPLLQAQDSDPAGALGFFQIALSPDGKTIAASLGYVDMVVGDPCIYLVDLGSADRKVTKIPIPFGPDK